MPLHKRHIQVLYMCVYVHSVVLRMFICIYCIVCMYYIVFHVYLRMYCIVCVIYLISMASVYASMYYAYAISKVNGCNMFNDLDIASCALKTTTHYFGIKI